MNDMDSLRLEITYLGRKVFTAKELIEDHGYSVFVYRQLGKLVKNEEIEKMEGTRPAAFKIIKLKETALVRKEKRAKRISKKNDITAISPWANIFPEYFTPPNLSGTSRFILNFDE